MPGLDDLYREIILDHYQNPRNRGELPVPPASHAEGHNPLCGDEVTVFVDVDDDGVVTDVKASSRGCAISTSSGSMMTLATIGKPVDEVRDVIRRFKAMMSITDDSGDEDSSDDSDDAPTDMSDLGDLPAFQGVVRFPARIKCATLPWNTLVQALDAAVEPVTDAE